MEYSHLLSSPGHIIPGLSGTDGKTARRGRYKLKEKSLAWVSHRNMACYISIHQPPHSGVLSIKNSCSHQT